MSTAIDEQYVTIRQVAALLGKSYWAAYSLATSGRLGPPIRVGTSQLYSRAIVEREIEGRKAAAPCAQVKP